MARPLETAAPADVLAAIAGWATQRAKLTDEREIPAPQTEKAKELLALLKAEKGAICAGLVNLIKINGYSTRLWLKEVSPTLIGFLRQTYRNREVLDTMRTWFKRQFGGHIRVEGDPDYAGYYLDLA